MAKKTSLKRKKKSHGRDNDQNTDQNTDQNNGGVSARSMPIGPELTGGTETSETIDARFSEYNTSRSPEESLAKDLGWIEFNRRVFNEAIDMRTPLLERVRFLSIFSSNLDEFFMKRVGSLKLQIAAGVISRKGSGIGPYEHLREIRKAVLPLIQNRTALLRNEIIPSLRENGIFLLSWEQLSAEEQARAKKYFRANVFPILTPLAVDPGHPFPFLSNLSTSLGVTLQYPDRDDDRLFARVKVPQVLPQWIKVSTPDTAFRDSGGFKFVSLQEIIVHNINDLFPEMIIPSIMPFRVTRSAEVERDEDEADDLREMIEHELRERRFAPIVRIEHGPNPDPTVMRFLIEELDLSDEDVYEVFDELSFSGLAAITSLNIPKLKYPSFTPITHPDLIDEKSNIFQVIRKKDILVHHPYDSFTTSVERFIRSAANDPKVLAIKLTLYRTSEDSPFIPMLIRAAESGKQVVCVVELKARFDEARNIYWAEALENVGVHVVYGIVGFKTHTKIALVVRQEQDLIRSYAHIGTGNYNSTTAKLYTDFGLLTAREDITEEVVDLFHFLTGRSLKKEYKKLLVAPINMRERVLSLIDREAGFAKKGLPARIIAKMNNLDDDIVCKALYEAARAGVSIDLIIRGYSQVRTGAFGTGDKIKVISVIGRFLEHSRVLYFQNGQKDPLDGEIFIGSADWMVRNLVHRVEAMVPLETRFSKEKAYEVLQTLLEDERSAWEMQVDGTYRQRNSSEVGSHQALIQITKNRFFRSEE
jgi:polyphosphate kinase